MNLMKSHSRTLAWAIWIIASVFYTYQYILRVMPNIMLVDIMEQFGINAATFGQFSGVYYLGYSLMHLPIGIMLDRYGPRKIMTLCIIFTVLGLMPLIFAKHWFYPIMGRFFIGLGSSAAILGVFKIIRMSFSDNHFPRMLSISVTIGLMGAIYGGGPVSYMKEHFGYQSVVQMFAVAGLILALITYWIIPDIKSTSNKTVFGDIKLVLSNKKVVWACLFAGLMVGPLEGFADVWGTLFLKNVYGFDSILSSSIPSTIFVGMCFGSPLLNLIAEKTGYLRTIIASGIIMTFGFLSFIIFPLPAWMLFSSFFIVGICCAYQILAIYKASTYVNEQVAGLTTAIANMIIMIFGYVLHAAMGSIINYFGGPNQPEALIFGIAIIPFTLACGLCGFKLLDLHEKKWISQESI